MILHPEAVKEVIQDIATSEWVHMQNFQKMDTSGFEPETFHRHTREDAKRKSYP